MSIQRITCDAGLLRARHLLRLLCLAAAAVPLQAAAVYVQPGESYPLTYILGDAPLGSAEGYPTGYTIPYWSIGVYFYVNQPPVPITITGGTPVAPQTTYNNGQELYGSTFEAGTDVWYQEFGWPKEPWAPYSGGYLTVDANYTGSSVTIPLAVKQALVLTGETCGTPDFQYSCGYRTNELASSVTLKVANLHDLLENSVYATPDNGGMYAQFAPQPEGQFSLEEAAQLGGFDHFNWVQRVTAMGPVIGGQVISLPGLLDGTFGVARLDPALGGNPDMVEACGGQDGADRLPFYWNEYSIGCQSGYDVMAHTFDPLLFFIDYPLIAASFWEDPNYADFHQNSWAIEFETSLWGVTDVLSGIDLSLLYPDLDELTFRWRYTQPGPCTTCGDTTTLSNIDPARGGGGYVEFLGWGKVPSVDGNSVPEPATLALFGLGLAGLGAIRRKKLAA